MNRLIARIVLPLVVAAVDAVGCAAGCSTMGTGAGATPSGTDAVSFNWKGNTASNSGTMTASLSDGTTYSGQYLQIILDATVDSFEPFSVGWRGRRGGHGWDDWGTQYAGRVVANLGTARGAHMRCKFQLADPTAGMSGGGRGQCHMPDGNTIDATFPGT